MVKIPNFGQKSKYWSKIEILVKNRNFGQESNIYQKILTEIPILVQIIYIFASSRHVGRQSYTN